VIPRKAIYPENAGYEQCELDLKGLEAILAGKRKGGIFASVDEPKWNDSSSRGKSKGEDSDSQDDSEENSSSRDEPGGELKRKRPDAGNEKSDTDTSSSEQSD